MNAFLAVVVSTTCLWGGCKSDPPESMMKGGSAATAPGGTGMSTEARAAIDKHASMMKAKWEAALAVASDAKAAPPVTQAEPLASPLAAAPTIPERQLRTAGDTLFAAPERVADPAAPLPFGVWTRPLLGTYNELLAPTATTQMPPNVIDADFGKIAGIKYALMVRTRDIKPSKVVTAMVGGQGELRYEAGSVAGDAILYELDTKRRLGAFPFAFQAKGDYVAKSGASPDEETKRLEDHLRDSVTSQLEEALAGFATGKGAPTATAGAAAADRAATVERAILVEVGTKFPGAAPGKVALRGKQVIVEAANPKAIDANALKELTAFASKQLGADVTVELVEKK